MTNSLVSANDLEATMYLIEKEKLVNARDDRGSTPLHAAIQTENLQILEFLLRQPEVDIDAKSYAAETPLFLSTKLSSRACALKLLAYGADVNILCGRLNESPLHLAVQKSQEISLELIRRGADVNTRNLRGITPLHHAVKHSDFAMVSMLVYYGANVDVVDVRGYSPFMLALSEEVDVQIQELLMELEVDFNRITSNGFSTLMIALIHRSPLCLEIIKRGADVTYMKQTCSCLSESFYSHEVLTMIWDKFDLKKLYTNINDTNDLSLESFINSLQHAGWMNDYWLNGMRKVFISEKGVDLLLSLSRGSASRLFRDFLKTFRFREIPEDELYEFVCVWMSCGVSDINFSDLLKIYKIYGFNNVFALMIHMNVRMNMPNLVSVPYLICDVNFNNFHLKLTYLDESDLNAFCTLLEFYTPSKKNTAKFDEHKHLYNKCYSNLSNKIELRLKNLSSVPSLIELSRNSTKQAICKKYCVENCSRFYSILKWLPVPYVMKDIISFKVPVNRFNYE